MYGRLLEVAQVDDKRPDALADCCVEREFQTRHGGDVDLTPDRDGGGSSQLGLDDLE